MGLEKQKSFNSLEHDSDQKNVQLASKRFFRQNFKGQMV